MGIICYDIWNLDNVQFVYDLQANEDELNLHQIHLQEVLQVGQSLIEADNLGSETIQQRIDGVEDQWKHLMNLTNERKKRLLESVELYQVNSMSLKVCC